MIINYLLNFDQDLIYAEDLVLLAMFELGMRVGIPFSIHRTSSSIQTDAKLVVSYGQVTRTDIENTIVLPRAMPKQHVRGCAVSMKAGRKGWGIETSSGPDIIAGAAELVGFIHEKNLNKDAFDNKDRIKPDHHPLIKNQVADDTLLENNAGYIRDAISAQRALPEITLPWNTLQIVISHDVDGPFLQSKFSILRSLLYVLFKRSQFEKEALELALLGKIFKNPDLYYNFEYWQKVETLIDASSTFFLYPGNLKTVKRSINDPHYKIHSKPLPDTIKRLSNDAWEIGLHSGINVINNSEAYAESINVLADIIDMPISSCRAHYWRIDWQDPFSSWKAMDSAGLRYDASLNLLDLGFRGGSMFPIVASGNWRGLKPPYFLSFPTVFMDAYLLTDNNESSIKLDSRIKAIIDSAAIQNGLLVWDWHCRTLSNIGPYNNYFSKFLELIELVQQKTRVSFINLRQAGELWRKYIEKQFKGVY